MGVRKLPVPGAGWALQTPRGFSGCSGSRDRRRRKKEKCTWGENTQNLRHQTDKEVAIWGQRNTEAAPREASRHTSQSSRACLAHSDTQQMPSAKSGMMNMCEPRTDTQ